MERYLTSNAKSAVSMEDNREWGVQTVGLQVMGSGVEVQRLNRKIDLLERGKKMLWEQLEIYKEENGTYKNKIKQLQGELQAGFEGKGRMSGRERGMNYADFSVVMSQKEEQVGLVQQQLRIKQQQIQKLSKSNEYLANQLNSKVATLTKLKQSAEAQKHCLRTQIQALQDDISELRKKQEQQSSNHEQLINVQSNKWKEVNQKLCDELEEAYHQISQLKAQKSEIRQLKDKQQSQAQELHKKLGQEQEKGQWLSGLLEEAKGQFIHATLVHGQQKQRAKREKKDLERRARWLSSRIKGCSQQASTAANSALSSCKSSRISKGVAPFNLTPKPKDSSGGSSSNLSFIALDSASMHV